MTLHEAIYQALPSPILLFGPGDEILEANPAAEDFFALSRKQVMRRGIAAVAPGSLLPEMCARVRRTGGSVVQHDVDIGPLRPPVMVQAVPGEAPGHVVTILTPPSLAGRIDRSLAHRSAARSIEGMAATLAHEIRTPLAGISGAAQLLAMELGEAARPMTVLIQQEAERIGKLVERVEQFGDRGAVTPQPVNLHDVLDRARRAARAGFAGHVRIHEQYDPSLPPAAGDPDRLQQVFQNLLKNAAEAVPEQNGQIVLATAFRPGVRLPRPGAAPLPLPLEVTVRDNGHGIPDGLAADIFDPFVSTKANGSGLGLALVAKIVADHGGTLDCRSRPGETEFQILLPVWEGD